MVASHRIEEFKNYIHFDITLSIISLLNLFLDFSCFLCFYYMTINALRVLLIILVITTITNLYNLTIYNYSHHLQTNLIMLILISGFNVLKFWIFHSEPQNFSVFVFHSEPKNSSVWLCTTNVRPDESLIVSFIHVISSDCISTLLKAFFYRCSLIIHSQQ